MKTKLMLCRIFTIGSTGLHSGKLNLILLIFETKICESEKIVVWAWALLLDCNASNRKNRASFSVSYGENDWAGPENIKAVAEGLESKMPPIPILVCPWKFLKHDPSIKPTNSELKISCAPTCL